jgi:hypothetical protein
MLAGAALAGYAAATPDAEQQAAVDQQLADNLKRAKRKADKFSPYTKLRFPNNKPVLLQDGPFKRQDANRARSKELAAMSKGELKRLGLLPKKPKQASK